uniref:Uncharacterized protein n=1 Tax=Oryza rufipogon TaxID=4529 RepID=A0A0E0R740_ORYRU
MVLAGEEGRQGSKSRNQSNSSMSEKDVVGNPNLHSGPEVFTEGVIDEEDDDAVEVVLEEDEIAKAEVFSEGVIDEEDDDAVEVVLEEDEIAKAGRAAAVATSAVGGGAMGAGGVGSATAAGGSAGVVGWWHLARVA